MILHRCGISSRFYKPLAAVSNENVNTSAGFRCFGFFALIHNSPPAKISASARRLFGAGGASKS
jgi:hypothetical protein